MPGRKPARRKVEDRGLRKHAVDDQDQARRDQEPQRAGAREGPHREGPPDNRDPSASDSVMRPTVAVVAADEPQTAAKRPQAITLTCSRRPGIRAVHGARPRNRLSATRVRNRISAIRMNRGKSQQLRRRGAVGDLVGDQPQDRDVGFDEHRHHRHAEERDKDPDPQRQGGEQGDHEEQRRDGH